MFDAFQGHYYLFANIRSSRVIIFACFCDCHELLEPVSEPGGLKLQVVLILAGRSQQLGRDVPDSLQTVVELGQGLYMRPERHEFRGRRGCG